MIWKWFKTIFFKTWFPNWSPDAALRYLPVVKKIRHDNSLNTILDVGSGSLGISPYLRRMVTGVDTSFYPPYTPLLKRITGNASNLPFGNNTFDAVICIDVLEHISSSQRKKIVRELMRIGKKKIFIAFPCGKEAIYEDRFFARYTKKVLGSTDPYIAEHLRYGLPEVTDIISGISQVANVRIYGIVNIWLHRIILLAQFSNHKFTRFLSSVVFVLLLPFFLLINLKPTYRKLIVIEKNN